MQTLIIADDLTGAADCALACGPGTLVLLNAAACAGPAEAVAIDANTRSMDADHAARETARIVRAHPAELVYKKIDSTLRGHARAEIEAAWNAYREMGHPEALAVVAPAFPAMGRTTRGGRLHLHGVALDWEPWPEMRDAETDADLRNLVAEHRGRDVLWAGSAGLMCALKPARPKAAPLELPELTGPIVFAIGSNAKCSREQAEALRGVDDAVILTGAPAALAERVAGMGHIGALVLTGGDTARAVLLALGVTALRVAREIESGVPMLLAEGPLKIPVVTKSGSFGDRGTLLRVLDFLRPMLRQGLRQAAADDERDCGQAQGEQ